MNASASSAAQIEAIDPELAAQERGHLDKQWVVCFLTKDDDLLHNLIYTEFGLYIPRVAVCHDHDAPFTFVADMLFGRVRKAIVLANRSGGKTLNLALIHVIRSTVRSLLAGIGLDTAHVAAVNIQATRCYDYVKRFNKVEFVHRYVQRLKELMSHTNYTTGAKVEILPGTMNAVNGPHPPFATFDEVELAAWEVIQEFMSMSQSKEGVEPQDIFTSTRKRIAGSMQKLLDEAPQRGIRVYTWCIFEILRRNDTCTPETCGIAGCGGRCTRADGYYAATDAAEKQRTLDAKTWDEQWECKKPGRSGLVYDEFEDEPGVLHVQQFRVNDADTSCDAVPDNPSSFVFGEDFGFTNPNVLLLAYWHILPSGQLQLRVFDEVVSTKVKDSLVIEAEERCMEKWGITAGNIDAWWCDPSGAGEIQDRRDRGFPVRTIGTSEQKEITYGVGLVRKLISINPASGVPGVVFHPRCAHAIKEFGLYSMPDPTKVKGPAAEKPIKKDDHAPDALRMLVVGEHGTADTSGDGSESVLDDGGWIDPYAEATGSDDEPW